MLKRNFVAMMVTLLVIGAGLSAIGYLLVDGYKMDKEYEAYKEVISENEAKARELSQFTKHEIELAMDLQADEDEKGTGTVVYLKKVNGHTHIGWDYTGETERLFSE